MMPEISLNILDVMQNSISAGSKLTYLYVTADNAADTLTVEIVDNGCGMTAEQLKSVENPFFTTRTTRKVGLGVPFFKEAAQITGGSFSITSEVGVGTAVKAVFKMSSIDRMPLGDMVGTVMTIVTMNPDIDFVYRYKVDEREFTLDTREFRAILGDVPFSEPEVAAYIKEYLTENTMETEKGQII